MGQIDEAIANARKAIELDPKFGAWEYTTLAYAQTAKGQHDEAIANCKKAIELDPNDPFIHSQLGSAYKANGQLVEAIASDRKAIELDPNQARFHDSLGFAYRENGQLNEAIACFTQGQSTELDPKLGRAQLQPAGFALKSMGRAEEAVASYKKSIELDPKNARAHNNLGIEQMAKGQVDEAIASYRKAILETRPGDVRQLPHNNRLGVATQG